jgi:predicted phosphodiesterase
VTTAKRVLWDRLPGLREFLVTDAQHLINKDLAEAIESRWKIRPTHAQLHNLRTRYAATMTEDARRVAYDRRTNTATPPERHVPSFVRELGPKDEGYFVTVNGDCLVTSDWHLPHHKEDLFERLLEVAKAWKIQRLIINGDFLNMDAFSKWKGHRFNVPWNIERDVAQHVIQRLFDTFEEVVYILDNHDRRLIAANEKPSEFDESNILILLTAGTRMQKLRPSVDYHYVIVNKTWRVTSPKEYRRNKLALPTRLASLYHSNVINGGDHLFGLGTDDSGRYVVANSMCLVDPAKTPYINVQDTTFPHWNPGFYMIRNNRLTALPDRPDLTDWDEFIRVGRYLTREKK